ncbi:hypothetical protein F5Y15DRAFT_411590 [Xylariaceae sp. FL0016]|nr:hypothetical protein F5Y15DRAFT_411590 [Xylariaceae sp. FL0016]
MRSTKRSANQDNAPGSKEATSSRRPSTPTLSLDSSGPPQFSYGKQLNLLSPTPEEPPSSSSPRDHDEPIDWLAAAESEIAQDLETTRKELELIHATLQDLDLCLDRTASGSGSGSGGGTAEETHKTPPASPPRPRPQQQQLQLQLQDQRVLLAACQEYARSRCSMLRERLRQTRFWAGSRALGRDMAPGEAPGEWGVADREWRAWLGEKAAAAASKTSTEAAKEKGKEKGLGKGLGNGDGKETGPVSREVDGGIGMMWGPLAHVLSASLACSELVAREKKG